MRTTLCDAVAVLVLAAAPALAAETPAAPAPKHEPKGAAYTKPAKPHTGAQAAPAHTKAAKHPSTAAKHPTAKHPKAKHPTAKHPTAKHQPAKKGAKPPQHASAKAPEKGKEAATSPQAH